MDEPQHDPVVSTRLPVGQRSALARLAVENDRTLATELRRAVTLYLAANESHTPASNR